MDTEKWERKQARWEERLACRTPRSSSGGIVIGGIIVAVGTILLLDNMGIIRSHDIWRYWPLAMIAFGVARIVESRRPAALIWGGTVAGLGALFLLDNLGIFEFDFHQLWPVFIIIFGISMLLRALDRSHAGVGGVGGVGDSVNSDSTISLYAVFSGGKRRINAPNFLGGEVFAIFGGFHVDLRGSEIPSGRAVLDLNSIFGGTELIVPETWRVTLKGMGIFGGFEDKTMPPNPQPGVIAPELVVTGSSIFGGAQVRN